MVMVGSLRPYQANITWAETHTYTMAYGSPFIYVDAASFPQKDNLHLLSELQNS